MGVEDFGKIFEVMIDPACRDVVGYVKLAGEKGPLFRVETFDRVENDTIQADGFRIPIMWIRLGADRSADLPFGESKRTVPDKVSCPGPARCRLIDSGSGARRV